MPRSQIKPARYNPRTLSEYARKQLTESLKRFGLVETLVWNERTGVLVSGHQRLSIMDRENDYPKCGDYQIEVSVVNLSDKRERELNVWINNRSAQGTFDRDLFADFLSESKLNLDDIGFTRADLEFEFGSFDGFDSILDREAKAADPVVKSAEEMAQRRKEMREKRNREEAKRDERPENDSDYYVLVCFNSANEKEAFLRKSGFPLDAKFVTAAEFFAAARSETQ